VVVVAIGHVSAAAATDAVAPLHASVPTSTLTANTNRAFATLPPS
jgi:hypothetical protein